MSREPEKPELDRDAIAEAFQETAWEYVEVSKCVRNLTINLLLKVPETTTVGELLAVLEDLA